MSDFGRMVAAGATPVTGEVVEGELERPEADPFQLADPEDVDLSSIQGGDEDEPRENPYIHFGERILVHEHPDTGEIVITKPFPLPPGKGRDMIELARALQPFPFTDLTPGEDGETVPALQPPNPDIVEFLVLPNWDKEVVTDPKLGPGGATPGVVHLLADLLVVTAGYDRLEEVEDFINLFAAGARQIEIEAKIVEVVESDLMDIGIRPLNLGDAIFNFPEGVFVDSFGFDLPNTSEATEAFLSLGAVQDGTSFNAVLEALESFSNVTIDQRPKVAVREGVPATILSTEKIPYYKIATVFPNVTATLDFLDVGVELYCTPRVVGTATLALDLHIVASQQVGNLVTSTGEESFETPIIATRTAKTVVYLKPGQALIIGGLTSERATQVTNRVPILGQIPILGMLFRSKLDTTETTYSMFVISPRIIQNNEFNAQL